MPRVDTHVYARENGWAIQGMVAWYAATGTRIVASLAKMLNDKGSGRGLISICTGGGMGVTAILEK